MQNERTLFIIKPDAVKKGIIGKIISRLEETGLKMVACKMVWIDREFAKKHYAFENDWAKKIYAKTKIGYEQTGKIMPFKNYKELGELIQNWSMDFITEGPVVAMVWQGPHAIELVRKIVGMTEPRQSAPGTIRGDFASVESYAVANPKKRVLKNLVHASDLQDNAKLEINLWFKPEELHTNYKILNDYLLE